MTECSKRAVANRANAQKSTGPRSAAGKAKVRHNARKHGLSVPIAFAGALPPKYEAIADLLADGRPEAQTAARHAAEIRYNLDRLDRAAFWLFVERFDELLDEGFSVGDPLREPVALRDIGHELRKLTGLRRKQESRWRKAVTALDGLDQQLGKTKPN